MPVITSYSIHYTKLYDIPNKNDSNIKRWKPRKYWLNFCNTLDKIGLYTPCDTEYNLAKCEDYVYRQCGNALHTLLTIKGTDKLVKELEQRKPSSRSIKYDELIATAKLASQEKYADNPLVQAELMEQLENV